jgi:hypothetical protein
MNASSSPRTDGDDAVTCNDSNAIDEIGERLGEMELGETSNHTSLSTLPDTVLLNIFSFILSKDKLPYANGEVFKFFREHLKVQLALEKTCRRFSAFLGQDATMRLLYQNLKLNLEFSYQVETMREKLFITNGLRMINQYQLTIPPSAQGVSNSGVRMAADYQRSTDNQICKYMGGADGVRRLIGKILITMERQCDDPHPNPNVASPRGYYTLFLRPPAFPENGFKLFLRGDSIAYLTEVVEQHMVYRLNNAWTAALFRSNPKESHPYPMLCENDIMFVDSIRSSDFGAFHSCNICSGKHCCTRLSFSDSQKIWEWPEDNCLEDDILGADQRQRMVRAIASRAGIVKLTGSVFDSIAAEILHFMATIVIDAFEGSKSLWCPGTNVAYFRNLAEVVTTALIDDEIIGEESDNVSEQNYLQYDYITNHPPPPSPELDEDGKHVCVIIPRQIKDAAVRLGMKPLLDSQSWEVSEGRTKKEEVNEALSMYGLSPLDDDSSSEVGSDGESVWQPNSADEADSDSDSEEGGQCRRG